MTNDPDTLAQEIAEIITKIVNNQVDPTKLEARFVEDYDADSMDFVDIADRLEERYSVLIPNDDLKRFATFGDVVQYISSQSPNP